MKCFLCLMQLLTVYFTISVTVTFREHIFSILQEPDYEIGMLLNLES